MTIHGLKYFLQDFPEDMEIAIMNLSGELCEPTIYRDLVRKGMAVITTSKTVYNKKNT